MAVRVEVEIRASAEVVWAVLADVERWTEWTPSTTRIELLEGDELGAESRVRIKQPRLPATVWRVSDFVAGQRFTWDAPAFGVTTTATHAIAPGTDGVNVTLSVETRGRLSWLARPLVEWISRRYVRQEAAGLKRRCESGSDAAD